MAHGHHRLDPLRVHLVKQSVIILQSFLIRLRLISTGKDPAPGDTGTKCLEAHSVLTKQCQILFITMVKIDCLMGGIMSAQIRLPGLAVPAHGRLF